MMKIQDYKKDEGFVHPGPTYSCYRFLDTICWSCDKEKYKCGILTCIDCGMVIYPINYEKNHNLKGL